MIVIIGIILVAGLICLHKYLDRRNEKLMEELKLEQERQVRLESSFKRLQELNRSLFPEAVPLNEMWRSSEPYTLPVFDKNMNELKLGDIPKTRIIEFEDEEVDENPRTITQILIDADNADTKIKVFTFWLEIKKNKKKYPLVELEFAVEHLQMLTDKL